MTPATLPVIILVLCGLGMLVVAFGVRGPSRVVMLRWYVRGLSPFNRAMWDMSQSIRRAAIALGRAVLPILKLYSAAVDAAIEDGERETQKG